MKLTPRVPHVTTSLLRAIPTPSREWIIATRTVGLGLLIALGLHTVAEIRYIPSQSMMPTLQVGNRVIVEKVSYRFHAPQRGDIVVFKAPPSLVTQNIHEDFIKRIIGLPGETITVKQGRVYINGRALSEPYIQTPPDYTCGLIIVPAHQYFVLGDNRNHSYDSHFWGFVPRKDIIGDALLKLPN